MERKSLAAIAFVVVWESVFAKQAMAFEFLDDLIYSAKCVGADDVAACKVKAKQDYENYAQGKAGVNGTTAAVNGGAAPIADSHNINYRERCEEVSAAGPASVDTAYNRAMNKFRFMSPEEHARVKFALPGFKHSRLPGVRYDIVMHSVFPEFVETNGEKASGLIDLALVKADQGNGSVLRVRFCQGTSDKYPNPFFSDPNFWSSVSNDFRSFVR